MNSNLIQYLQEQQIKLLDAVYIAHNLSDCDPSDSFKKHALSAARAAYDKSVIDLQRLHPMGADCPAHFCDCSLYQFFSDFHKDAYGFRYRGDMSIAEMKERMPQMQRDIIENEAWEAERDNYRKTQDEQERLDWEREQQEGRELEAAYCVKYDHHDPRIAA